MIGTEKRLNARAIAQDKHFDVFLPINIQYETQYEKTFKPGYFYP